MRKTVACAAMAAVAVCACAGQMKPKALMIMVDGMRADVMENAPMTNLLRLRDGRWQKGYRGFSSITGHTLYDARPSSAANHAAIATGKCKVSLSGDVDDFALWTRALTREEVRRIHDAGRKGHALGTMLNFSDEVATCK